MSSHYKQRNTDNENSLTGFLVAKGIAKNQNQANIFLLVILILVSSISIIFFTTSGTNKNIDEKYYFDINEPTDDDL